MGRAHPTDAEARASTRPAGLAQNLGDIGQRADVAELVGVDDRADRPDLAAGDLEGHDAEEVAVGPAEDRTGLPVDLGLGDRHPQPARLAYPGRQRAGDATAALDRAGERRDLAAAVAGRRSPLPHHLPPSRAGLPGAAARTMPDEAVLAPGGSLRPTAPR